MSTSRGAGEALDASVTAERTIEQQAYLDEVAEAAERAVGHVQDMIDNLQASLEGRRAEAERARAEAAGDEGSDA